jgi:glycosyltransferase involved in cell wall biosynthesis
LKPMLRNRAKYFFLSTVQRQQFESAFGPGLSTSDYANYSDLEEARSHDLADDMTRFIFVGRLIAQKGVCETLQAYEELRTEFPRLQMSLKICGDGPLAASLKARYSGLARSGGLVFLGHVEGSELAAAYASSDVLVLPTTYPEGFPYVMIEAYENQLCVLATREGALANHVINGVTGFHLDAPLVSSLKERMQFVATDRNALRSLSNGAKQYFESHLTSRHAIRFYGDLLSEDLTRVANTSNTPRVLV